MLKSLRMAKYQGLFTKLNQMKSFYENYGDGT